MEKILVTGGAGYIGSHACKVLRESGYVPIALDNLITGSREAVKYGPLEVVDLLDTSKVGDVFEKYSPSAVMHFAALSQVGESVQLPGKYWENNVIGSLNLIQAAIRHNCKNVVFSSTCATYGDQDNVLLDENCEQSPVNAYGASKLAVEQMLANFSLSAGIRYVTFRYFNVAGSAENAEIGEAHDPETHLIPLVLEAIDGKRDALKIFGTDYDTPDGTCIRDFVHVCDLVDAHVLGLEWLLGGKENRVYNLGTGHGFSVLQVIDAAEKVTGLSAPVIEAARRSGDCQKLVSGSSRAAKELGWTPTRSTLDKMIGDAWNWHQHRKF